MEQIWKISFLFRLLPVIQFSLNRPLPHHGASMICWWFSLCWIQGYLIASKIGSKTSIFVFFIYDVPRFSWMRLCTGLWERVISLALFLRLVKGKWNEKFVRKGAANLESSSSDSDLGENSGNKGGMNLASHFLHNADFIEITLFFVSEGCSQAFRCEIPRPYLPSGSCNHTKQKAIDFPVMRNCLFRFHLWKARFKPSKPSHSMSSPPEPVGQLELLKEHMFFSV